MVLFLWLWGALHYGLFLSRKFPRGNCVHSPAEGPIFIFWVTSRIHRSHCRQQSANQQWGLLSYHIPPTGLRLPASISSCWAWDRWCLHFLSVMEAEMVWFLRITSGLGRGVLLCWKHASHFCCSFYSYSHFKIYWEDIEILKCLEKHI